MKNLTEELPADYKFNANKLAEFIEARDNFLNQYEHLPTDAQQKFRVELAKLNKIIDDLEAALAKDYEKIKAERERQAKITSYLDKGNKMAQHLYIIIKHQQPHLLESFEEAALRPLLEEERQEFLDEVAILEATQLEAVLTGKA